MVKVVTDQPGLYGWGCATFTQRALVVQTARRSVPEAVPDRPPRRRDRGHLAVVLRQLVLAQRRRPLQRDERRRHGAVGHPRQARRTAALPAPRRQGAARRRLLLPRQRTRLPGSRGQRPQGDVARASATSACRAACRAWPPTARRGAARRTGAAPPTEPIGPTAPRDIWESAPYVRMLPKLFEHLRTKLGDEVQLLHDVHERVQLNEAHQPVQGARALQPVLPRGSVPAGRQRLVPAAAPADQHPDRDGRAVQHRAGVPAADLGAADRLHPHPHLADRRPDRRRARWRR